MGKNSKLNVKIQCKTFQDVDKEDPFFDPLRENYPHFDQWFLTKGHEDCFVVEEKGKIIAFMYLKIEDESLDWKGISPSFAPCRRLKIGTLKVEKSGIGIGKQLLSVAKTIQKQTHCKEIYVTVQPQERTHSFQEFLQHQGFYHYGQKRTGSLYENVYIFPES